MGHIEKVSVALTADMAGMVRQAVDSGEYATASEVIRDALRDWKAKRELSRRQIEELRRLVDEGLESGSAPWEGADALLLEARRRAKAKI